jgi:hypothetical protein
MVLGVGVIFSMAAPLAHAACSDASLAGEWGFTITGTIILPNVGPAPVGAVGRIAFDRKGKVVGEQTRSVGGEVADETFSGTYKATADCMADFTVQVFESGNLVRTSTVHLILDDNLREIRAIFTSSALPDSTPLPSILTAEAKRLFSRN